MTNLLSTTSDSAPMHPGQQAVGVTPSDTSALPFITRGIYVGVTGNLAVVPYYSGAPVTFNNVQAGSIIPIRATFVMATNTTASGIVIIS